MLRTGSVVVVLGLLVALVVSCQPSRQLSRRGPSESDIAFLASDAHIVVGDVPLVLPFVALPDQVSMGQVFTLDRQEAIEEWREQRDAFRAAASDPGGAPTLGRVGVHVDTWGWGDDENVSMWMTLCPQLTREWSRSVCDDPWAPLDQALPDSFFLLDDRHPEALNMSLSWDGRYQDFWDVFTLHPAEPTLACDPEPSDHRRCWTARPINRHLVALWSVGDRNDETAEQVVAREGRAIAAFVRLGLGPEERFVELEAIACDTRQPGSEAGPRQRETYACNDS